jgi:hypothetical protein
MITVAEECRQQLPQHLCVGTVPRVQGLGGKGQHYF